MSRGDRSSPRQREFAVRRAEGSAGASEQRHFGFKFLSSSSADPVMSGAHRKKLRPPAWLVAVAGPALIVTAVLLVLRGIAFGGLLTFQHIDILPYWLPTYCYLGKSIASAHIPTWNPYVMGGVPFAADPQSGWGYLPAMLLFSLLPCDLALRWFIVLQPILAGLGVYWFLRGDGISRVASSTGGLALAMILANSYFGLFLGFPGIIAWTALSLAAASRFVRSRTPSKTILWGTATALAWGQAVDAYLVHGALIGTLALTTYLTTSALARRHAQPVRSSLIRATLLLLLLPLVNLAVLLPRLAYLPRTILSQGYGVIEGFVGLARPANWPLELAMPPGPFAGATALALSFAAWRSKQHRVLFLGMAGCAAFFYLISIGPVARALAPGLQGTFVGQLYLHEPYRFEYGALLLLAILIGLGTETWTRARGMADRRWMLAPAVLVWGLLPPLFLWGSSDPQTRGAFEPSGIVLTVSLVLAAITLFLTALRRAPFALIPIVLAVELVMTGLVGQGLQIQQFSRAWYFSPFLRPTVDARAYMQPGPIVDAMKSEGDGRYVSYDRDRISDFGYLLQQRPDSWGLLANQRSMLFGIEDVGGYSSAQLPRYWTFVRAVDPAVRDSFYNSAFFVSPPPMALDLLDVSYVVAPIGRAPPWLTVAQYDVDTATWVFPGRDRGPRVVPVVNEGDWQLLRFADPPPLVSVLGTWRVAATPPDALDDVMAPAFDPGKSAVIEGIGSSSTAHSGSVGSAVIESNSPSGMTFTVHSSVPAAVLIRNAYDVNWHATVDDVPTQVHPADYVDQAIMVPAGNHTIRLQYVDPGV